MSSAAAAAAPLMTAEQLLDLPDDGLRHELVRGELRTMPPAGYRHGRVSNRVARRIDAFVMERGLGEVLTNDPGFLIERGPDTVRAPDVAFVSTARIPPPDADEGFVATVPDLVVEVVSPHDRASEVTQKALDWLAAGARLVWVLDPKTRSAAVHRPGGNDSLLIGDAELDGEDVLPGFHLRLAQLFDPAEPPQP